MMLEPFSEDGVNQCGEKGECQDEVRQQRVEPSTDGKVREGVCESHGTCVGPLIYKALDAAVDANALACGSFINSGLLRVP